MGNLSVFSYRGNSVLAENNYPNPSSKDYPALPLVSVGLSPFGRADARHALFHTPHEVQPRNPFFRRRVIARQHQLHGWHLSHKPLDLLHKRVRFSRLYGFWMLLPRQLEAACPSRGAASLCQHRPSHQGSV